MRSLSRTRRTQPKQWRADPAVRRLLTAHVLTYIGKTLSAVTLPVLAYQLTGSARHTAVLVSLEMVPYLLLGLPLGALADRANRRHLMVASEVLSAAVTASITAAALFDALTIGHLYTAVLGLGTTFVLHDAANFGALPSLVPEGELTDVLTWQWTIDSTLQITGPLTAGILIATIGATYIPLLDSVTYLASATLLGGINRPFQGHLADRVEPLARRLTAGARFIWRQPLVRSFTLLGIGNSLTAGAIVGLLVPFSVRQLGFSDSDGRLGLLYAVGAAGGLGAARLLASLATRPPTTTTKASLLITTCLVPILAVQTTLPAAAVLYGLVVAGTQLTILNGIAYRQKATPDHLQGRVNVLARMIAVAGYPVGAATVALLTDHLSIPTTLALAAAGTGTSAILTIAGPFRLPRPLPAPAAPSGDVP